MSNTSGLGVSDALTKEFSSFVDGNDRAALMHIVDEVCELERVIEGSSSLHADFDVLAAHLEDDKARYIAIRKEGKSFMFVSYVPDAEKVRSKMKYASSTNKVHKQLGGSSVFSSTHFWNSKAECSAKSWQAQLEHERAAAPLTAKEQSLKTAMDLEASRMGTVGRHDGLASLSVRLPVSASAERAIAALKEQRERHVTVFVVDDDETINALTDKDYTELAEARSCFPTDAPSYGVIVHNGHLVFIYLCPAGARIKQRMAYASTRVSFLAYLKEQLPIAEVVSFGLLSRSPRSLSSAASDFATLAHVHFDFTPGRNRITNAPD